MATAAQWLLDLAWQWIGKDIGSGLALSSPSYRDEKLGGLCAHQFVVGHVCRDLALAAVTLPNRRARPRWSRYWRRYAFERC